jgi:oxygen-independent coproporphyrinogen-3 oxidase
LNNVVRRYAGYQVPRYTSYPTAADFTPDVTAKQHATWLGRLDAPEGVSVYLHVPCCREICPY